MSPFGNTFGGPLESQDIDAIVAYLRSWEANPPVALPPVVATPTPGSLILTGVEIFSQLCSQCHGSSGEGGIGPALNTAELKQAGMDKYIFDAINLGTPSTPMIAWGKFLSANQIDQLVQFIRGLGNTPTSQAPAFATDVLPIFQASCTICHGTLGGWTATSYSSVMTTGNGGPVVIPGDAANSLLVQKLKGTQQNGSIMPPTGKLSDAQIQVIIDWINVGAIEK
jgi:cbb3-type cytochrome c oxidase subunit III